MIKFNSDNKEELSFAEALNPAMNITEQEEADLYFAQYVSFIARKDPGTPISEIADTLKLNLAYQAGYYLEETRERVERLFNCEHPVFGKFSEKGNPTAQEALKMGMDLAKKLMKNG